MRRSPNLVPARVRAIIDIIRRMAGAPTWPRIVRAVGEEMGHVYTRQALQGRAPIKAAYEARRANGPAVPGGVRLSARARAAIEREQRHVRRIAELEGELALYRERFVLWSHNAYARNYSEKLFERDLPPLDRARSRPSSKKRRRG